MALWARTTGLVLLCIHLALLLALSLGRAQTDASSMLAYLGSYQGETHSYLLDIQRQQSLRLSRSPMIGNKIHNPAWSLDGRFLAYGQQFNHLARIFIMDFHTGQIHLLADDQADNPAWLQRDTPQLVYTSPMSSAVQAFDPLTGETDRLMDYPLDYWKQSAMIWSSDGDALVVSWQSGNRGIYRLNPEDGTIVNLTHHVGENVDPAWSPDGEWIAFASNRNGRNYNIYVMDRNGEQIRNITCCSIRDSDPV